MKSRKGAMSPFGLGLFILVGIAFIASAAMLMPWDKWKVSLSQGGDPSVVDDIECTSETTPSIDIDAFDAFNPGTAITEATSVWRKKGDVAWTTLTLGTAFTGPSVGDEIEILIGATAADQTENGYGPHIITGEVPCDEEVDLKDLGYDIADVPVYNDELETSLTFTFYNDDDSAAAETFTTGQTQDIYLKWTAATDEVCGNPYSGDTPNVVCLNLNSSEWDKPEKYSVEDGYVYNYNFDTRAVDTSSIAGKTLSAVPTPQQHTPVASMIAYCFEAPVVGPDGIKLKVRMNADDTNAPGTDMTAHLYCGSDYLDDKGDVAGPAVEDEDANAVGSSTSDTGSMDFT